MALEAKDVFLNRRDNNRVQYYSGVTTGYLLGEGAIGEIIGNNRVLLRGNRRMPLRRGGVQGKL